MLGAHICSEILFATSSSKISTNMANKGVTAVEILVVMTITVVTSAVALYSFPNFTQRVRVERAAREMAIKIRTAQQRTLAPKQVRKADGTLAVPRGFGIYLDTSDLAKTSYKFFADMDGNHFFNIAGGDVVIETVALPQDVIISQLKNKDGLPLSSINIVYTVPFSETKIYDSGGAPILGDILQVELSRGAGIVRFVTVRTTGLVTLGPAPQITAVADLTPPVIPDNCPGSNITQNPPADHWAWNDIVGWIDFCGGTSGVVNVTSTGLTGYATSSSRIDIADDEGGAVAFDSFGAIALDCGITNPTDSNHCGTVNYGVKNNTSGVLSGWAWMGGGPGAVESSYGWVSFNCSNTNSCSFAPYQVTIDPVTGDFHGFAWNDIIGWIAFNSADLSGTTQSFKVNTSWRPQPGDPVIDLKANASDVLTIPYNSSVILTWNSQNIDSCTVSQSSPPNACWNLTASPVATATQNFVAGTKCSNLVQTITFQLDCTPNSPPPPSVFDFVTVNVSPPLSVDLKVDTVYDASTTILFNTSANLTWRSTSTVSCSATGNWSGSKARTNTIGQSVGPQSGATTTTYYLDCISSDGTLIRDFVQVRWVESIVGDMSTPVVSTPWTPNGSNPPFDGAPVSGTVTLNVNAYDNVGVSGVQFKLDGVNLQAEDTTAVGQTYSLTSWNTTSVSNGIHIIRALARDAAGNKTLSSPLTVRVSN